MKAIPYPNYTNFFHKLSRSPKDTVEFIWLGQAGFGFRYNNISLIIDPYLSNYLSKKYKDSLFPHTRLMDIPIAPEQIKNLDFLISTHPHSDHMDPETIPLLFKGNPHMKFIIPAAAKEESIKRGAYSENLMPAISEKEIRISEEIVVIPIPAAHEELTKNEKGEHYYLGYIIKFGDHHLYHSGDCCPYDGLEQLLTQYGVQIAFLPINGRDEYRLSNGIAGNFRISEVLEICRKTSIHHLVVHHFGMFAYNTVTDGELEKLAECSTPDLGIIIPKMFYKYRI
ncbi:MAG: MBL fold metallo-hydrolase [Candidatus Lokiarchaeota archaeon]|nr:MBL fold metallo-hydrolase [Candidatus Lokiarchaeota archaeon]